MQTRIPQAASRSNEQTGSTIAAIVIAVVVAAAVGSIVLISFDKVSSALNEVVQHAIQSANEQPGTGYVRDPMK